MTNLSELLSAVLVKNTANVIIDYLTDPPVLPFVDELTCKTRYIQWQTEDLICYSTYYNSAYGVYHIKTKIGYRGIDWKIVSN